MTAYPQPEYGAWMIESVPSAPYGEAATDLLAVEANFKLRRDRLRSKLRPGEVAPSMSTFPMLGVAGYAHTERRGGPVAASLYVADDIINPHPRFGTLTQNIRLRRGANVAVKVRSEDGSDEVHMDAMAFG